MGVAGASPRLSLGRFMANVSRCPTPWKRGSNAKCWRTRARSCDSFLASCAIRGRRPLQKKMLDVLAKHPELIALIKQHDALAQRHEEARRQKLEGKTFVWD